MKKIKLYLGICLSVLALVVVSVGIFTFTQARGNVVDKSSRLNAIPEEGLSTCYSSYDNIRFVDCEPSRDPNAVARNVTVVLDNRTNFPMDVGFVEDLKNYQDAYYDFSTGRWNCSSLGFWADSNHRTNLQPGEIKTFEIHVEGSHSTFFGEMKVQNLYLTTSPEDVNERYTNHDGRVLNFSYEY
jgi:hypothetical protein